MGTATRPAGAGSPTILADANAYAALQGEPAFGAGQFIDDSVDPSTFNDQAECGGEAGWNEEQTLDVEAVHGLAPGATVAYVGAQNCDTGIDTALNLVVQNHTASIVSNSYGDFGEQGLGDEVTIEHSIFVQGAAEGIGFYFSSGDGGDNVADGDTMPEPNYPASDDTVTGVGGTSLGINSNNSYKFESAWGNFIDPVTFTTSPSTTRCRCPANSTQVLAVARAGCSLSRPTSVAPYRSRCPRPMAARRCASYPTWPRSLTRRLAT